jgi:hypothetical protein
MSKQQNSRSIKRSRRNRHQIKRSLAQTSMANPQDGALTNLPLAGPARMYKEEVAEKLGFQEYEIPILTRLGHLRPLGDPVQSSVKRFARVEIEAIAHDPDYLDLFTLEIQRYWREKKAKYKARKEKGQ